MKTAARKIFQNHNRQPFPEECARCAYLYLCKTGCPFVKNVYGSGKSYTCLLQQQMYRDRGYAPDASADETTYEYVTKMRLEEPEKYLPARTSAEYPALEQIIAQDAKLKYIYDSGVFELDVDGDRYPLISQILRKSREILYLTPISTVKLRMKKHMLQEECDYPENNALYLMLLSGDLVTYGDEGRTKQRHIATHQIYKGVLDHSGDNEEEWYVYDISGLLREYAKEYATDSPNNLLVTTTQLRDCHYRKQENNAYYHIQAINLPFQNIEFYYLTLDQKNDKEASHEF